MRRLSKSGETFLEKVIGGSVAKAQTTSVSRPEEASKEDDATRTRSRFSATSSRVTTAAPKEKLTGRLPHGRTSTKSRFPNTASTEKLTGGSTPGRIPTRPKNSNSQERAPGWPPPGLSIEMAETEVNVDFPMLPQAMSK